jgi:hypothetical protein
MNSQLFAGIALLQHELDKIDELISKELKRSAGLQKQITASRDDQKQLTAQLSELHLANICLLSEQADLDVVIISRDKRREEANELRTTLQVCDQINSMPHCSTG